MVRVIGILGILFLTFCHSSCQEAPDKIGDDGDSHQASNGSGCPAQDTAFVTTCGGTGGIDDGVKNDDDLADAVLDDILFESNESTSDGDKKPFSGHPYDDDSIEDSPAFLNHPLGKMIYHYYESLPNAGKCAVGVACGLTSSRLSLGAANRAFRLAGATWVTAEVLDASGFCDAGKCVPGEVRPWIGVARKAIVKQCGKVRTTARKLWNEDKIRGLAQQHEMASGGFAAGAFVGFII